MNKQKHFLFAIMAIVMMICSMPTASYAKTTPKPVCVHDYGLQNTSMRYCGIEFFSEERLWNFRTTKITTYDEKGKKHVEVVNEKRYCDRGTYTGAYQCTICGYHRRSIDPGTAYTTPWSGWIKY